MAIDALNLNGFYPQWQTPDEDENMRDVWCAMTIYQAGVRRTVLVWNGVDNYKRIPFPENTFAITDCGRKNLTLAKIGSPTGDDVTKTLEIMLRSTDIAILWARNSKTYNSIVKELRATAMIKFGGTPKPN